MKDGKTPESDVINGNRRLPWRRRYHDVQVTSLLHTDVKVTTVRTVDKPDFHESEAALRLLFATNHDVGNGSPPNNGSLPNARHRNCHGNATKLDVIPEIASDVNKPHQDVSNSIFQRFLGGPAHDLQKGRLHNEASDSNSSDGNHVVAHRRSKKSRKTRIKRRHTVSGESAINLDDIQKWISDSANQRPCDVTLSDDDANAVIAKPKVLRTKLALTKKRENGDMYAWEKGERERAWKKGLGSCSHGSADTAVRCDVTNVRGNGSVSAREPAERILTVGINRSRNCFLTPRPFYRNATSHYSQVTWTRSRGYASDVIRETLRNVGSMEHVRSSVEEDAQHCNGSTKDTRYDTFLDLSKLQLDDDVKPDGDVIESGEGKNATTLENHEATLDNEVSGQRLEECELKPTQRTTNGENNKEQDFGGSLGSSSGIDGDIKQDLEKSTCEKNGRPEIFLDTSVNGKVKSTDNVPAGEITLLENNSPSFDSCQRNGELQLNGSDCNTHTEGCVAMDKQNNIDSHLIKSDELPSQGAKPNEIHDETNNVVSNHSTAASTVSSNCVDDNISSSAAGHDAIEDGITSQLKTDSNSSNDTTTISPINAGVILSVESTNTERSGPKMLSNNMTLEIQDLAAEIKETNLKQLDQSLVLNTNESSESHLHDSSTHNVLQNEIKTVSEVHHKTSDHKDDVPMTSDIDSQSGSSMDDSGFVFPFELDVLSSRDKTLSLDRNAFKCQEIPPYFNKEQNTKKELADRAAMHSGMQRLYQITLSSVTSKEKSFAKIKDLFDLIEAKGIRLSDPRLKESFRKIEVEPQGADTALTFDVFSRICEPSFKFIRSILLSQLSVPGFSIFKLRMERIFEVIKALLDEVREEPSKSIEPCSSYNVMMRRQKQSGGTNLSLSVCTVDGQRLSFGDKETPHPLNSCASVFNFCLACRQNGNEKVSSYVGNGARPTSKDEFSFDEQGRVWNPFTKAGSLITTTLLFQQMMVEKRLDALHNFYTQLVGGEPICCDNLSYNYRRNYAHEEISLAHYLSAMQHLPRGASAELAEIMEFHLQSISTAMTADACAVGAATLANKGRCPLTDYLAIDRESIRNTFKVMKSSMMKALPCNCQSKREVVGSWNENGSVMLIVPGVLGLTCFTHCQSIDVVQKIAACIIKELNESFNFSVYKSLKDHECSSKKRK